MIANLIRTLIIPSFHPLRSTLLRWNAKQVYIELKQEYEWQNSKKHRLHSITKQIKRRISRLLYLQAEFRAYHQTHYAVEHCI